VKVAQGLHQQLERAHVAVDIATRLTLRGALIARHARRLTEAAGRGRQLSRHTSASMLRAVTPAMRAISRTETSMSL
jgi:hypothetical protein